MDIPSSSSTKSSHVNANALHSGSGTIKSPKGGRSSHTLTQDLNQASTSRSRPTAPTESAPKASQSGGLRAHLHHLLPRHALFHVQVQIHQLSSVPLVHGKFAVRWKFKHVHTPPPSLRSAVLQKTKEHSTGKGKEKAVDNGEESDGSADGSLEGDNIVNSREDSLPSVIVSSDDHSHVSTTTSESSAPSRFEQYLTADWLPHSILSRHSTPADSPSLSSTPVEAYAQARGRTEYIKLKDHNVLWEHTVNIVVQMDVDRDTSYLLPNELKLVVMQEVIPGDPDSPHNPRLGALYLNLAEYAAAGIVTRRYLLRESKTNATLKLTIQLEHVGGEASYNAPPLPKGEILAGIAGFLESDVYRVRPGSFRLYHDEFPGKVVDGVPFDVSTLPLACGPRATETLIEAIFNPVPTTSKNESPFTYYQPETKKGGPGVEGSNEMNFNKCGTNNGEGASVYSTESSGVETEHTNTSSTTSGHDSQGSNERQVAGADKKRWWTKIGVSSRPATPST